MKKDPVHALDSRTFTITNNKGEVIRVESLREKFGIQMTDKISLYDPSADIPKLVKKNAEVINTIWVLAEVTQSRITFTRATGIKESKNDTQHVLKRWRKQNNGCTQEKAASILGLTQGMISLIEKGERQLPPKIKERLLSELYKDDLTEKPHPVGGASFIVVPDLGKK